MVQLKKSKRSDELERAGRDAQRWRRKKKTIARYLLIKLERS
jgi:hypothetical protein